MKLLAICLNVIVLLGLVANPASAKTVCNKKCSKVLGLVNQERTKRGLGTVCINRLLMKAAAKHNDYQVAVDVMSHTGSGGSDIGDRVKMEGYDYKRVGENVAVGMSSAKNVMHGWMNSPGHKKNILSDNIHMGVAFSSDGKYWTQVFGTPQRTGGGCDVEVVGSSLGIIYQQVDFIGPECDGLCRKMVDHINLERYYMGKRSMCVSPELMYAAAETADRGYMQNGQSSKIEDAVADTGYSFQTYAISSLSVWVSGGKLEDDMIFDMFEKNLHEQHNTYFGDFSQVGIASDSSRNNWVLIFGSTWNGEEDKCDDGRSPGYTEAPEGMIAHGDVFGVASKNARSTRQTGSLTSQWITPSSSGGSSRGSSSRGSSSRGSSRGSSSRGSSSGRSRFRG